MKIACLIFVMVLTALVFVHGQEQEEQQFATYQEMRTHIGKLYQQKNYAEAARILEKALTRFPDHLHANTFNLAFMYVLLEEHEKAARTLEYGLDHGVWFGKYELNDKIWAPLEHVESFKEFRQKNEAKRQTAQKLVQPKLEIFVPENFDRSKKNPLFIALHGGGENIEAFKPKWISPLLEKELLLLP